MAYDRFDSFRLSLMQDFLPVGLAMVERVRKGGVNKVWEGLTSASDPFKELRIEGEPAARSLRDRLDQVSPGLGNPVMNVKVSVEDLEVEDQPLLNESKLLTIYKNNISHFIIYICNYKICFF